MLCKSFLQANLDLFVSLIYQAIELTHYKYLLNEAVAGYSFYVIVSNFANIQFFGFTEHITKGLSVETDQPPQMPSIGVPH